MATLTFDGVTKQYRDGTTALSELSLDVADGEFVVLVGPSGCGKSTALRLVAGLEAPSAGDIRIGGASIRRVSPGARDVAMVFQNYALYPHMTVRQNMLFGLRSRGVKRRQALTKVTEVSRFLGLEGFLARKPKALSGGQRQRVAMGRAIVRDPKAFLMDEPLSNLDAQLRVQMRTEVVRIQQELATTTLYVTHDQVEAMTMGDRVAVLAEGRLQQFAEPLALYREPASTMVARFIGNPPMNLAAGCIGPDGLHLSCGESASLDGSTRGARADRADTGRDVIVGFRAEDIRLRHEDAGSPQLRIGGSVQAVEHLGPDTLVHVRPLSGNARRAPETETQMAELPATLIARAPSEVRVSRGEHVRLSVPLQAVRLFEPSNGAAIASFGSPPRANAVRFP